MVPQKEQSFFGSLFMGTCPMLQCLTPHMCTYDNVTWPSNVMKLFDVYVREDMGGVVGEVG